MMFNRDSDVYDASYSYDDMKVMAVLSQCEEAKTLDYEDLCFISKAIKHFWRLSRVEHSEYPWLQHVNNEEIGYIQAYAQRVASNFIELWRKGID